MFQKITPKKNTGKNAEKNKSVARRLTRGFTLVEMMVAVSIFLVIMVISSGAILSVFSSNQKSKNLRAVMDNLNLTLDSMTRTIRFGTNYHCGGGIVTDPMDCGGVGATSMTVRAEDGTIVTYSLSAGRIMRTSGSSIDYLTSSDTTVTNLVFRVYGSLPYNNGTDLLQPEVIIVVGGYAGTNPKTQSTFSLETTVSQRVFDFE